MGWLVLGLGGARSGRIGGKPWTCSELWSRVACEDVSVTAGKLLYAEWTCFRVSAIPSNVPYCLEQLLHRARVQLCSTGGEAFHFPGEAKRSAASHSRRWDLTCQDVAPEI